MLLLLILLFLIFSVFIGCASEHTVFVLLELAVSIGALVLMMIDVALQYYVEVTILLPFHYKLYVKSCLFSHLFWFKEITNTLLQVINPAIFLKDNKSYNQWYPKQEEL